MRMRKKKNGSARMEACGEYVLPMNELSLAAKDKPLYVEIGCGKGTFLCESALRDGGAFFIGFERVFDVALLAAEKLREREVTNARVTVGNAAGIADMFAPHSVKRIYLNFSDPWPKARHAKRRLTYRSFLESYKKILTPDGEIFFKTDNRPLFDFSLEELRESGFHLRNITNDLHSSEWEEGNIHTEYEDNFSAKGFTINRVEAYLQP